MSKALKILLLEDMPTDAKLVQRELDKAGIKYDIKVVDNRQDFTQSLHSLNPDIILSDYTLPQFNGMEALEVVRQLPYFLPFVIVTGSINEETAVECIKAGATDYVTKERLVRLGPSVRAAMDKKITMIEKEIAEKALAESEEKFRYSFENANVGMVILDLEGNLIRTNPKYRQILSDSKSISEKQSLIDSILAEDKERFLDIIREGIEKKEIQTELELRLVKPDKSIVWATVSIALIHDSLKDPLFFIVHIQDVTLRKLALEQIRILSRSVEQSPASTIITDKEGKIEYVNPKFTKITGYSSDEVLGKNPNILKSGFLNDKQYSILWKKISGGEEWSGELLNKRKDGTLFWESASISSIVDDEGEITHYLAVKEDITEKKNSEKELIAAKERAEESDKLKTAFLQNISHEIRTPMNAIKGFSGLLNIPNLDLDKLQYYIKIINDSSDQLLSIIDDILNISFIETGQEKVISQKFNVNQTLDRLVQQFSSKAKERNLKISIEKGLEESESFIDSDEIKISKILSNLISNALKFTHKGIVKIGYTQKNNLLEFFVRDTGIGIPEDMKDKIFERFFQIDNTNTREYEGTGLGLALTKAYVNLLKGKMCVESKPGRGSSFSFTVPYHGVAEIKPSETFIESGTQLQFKSDRTILVVEDEDNNYFLIEEFLADFNLKLLWAKNGFEAIEFCELNPNIDLVLMDIKMPILNGYDTTRKIKAQFPNLIIIALTAYALSEDAGKAKEAGCSDFLSKPLRQKNLFRVINKYIVD